MTRARNGCSSLCFVFPLALVIAGCGNGSAPLDLGAGDGGTGDGAIGITSCGVGANVSALTISGTQRDDDGNGTPTNDAIRTISVADYARIPGLKVLAILVAAEWCVPCQNEQPEVVALYQKYQSQKSGVAMLEAIEQKSNATPADQTTTTTWAQHYHVPFDITYDPTMALAPCSDPSTYPSQLVIKLPEGTVQWTHNGYVSMALETAIDSVLSQ